jgi:hypothetical protein
MRFVSDPNHPSWLWGHAASCSMGTEALSPWVKWPGHEAEHSHQSSAFITWIGTNVPFYTLLSLYGNKERPKQKPVCVSLQ